MFGLAKVQRCASFSYKFQASFQDVRVILMHNLLHFFRPNTYSMDWSSKTFLINCLCASAVEEPLLGHEVAEEYVQALVENEVHVSLKRCGLSQKMPYFRDSLSKDTGTTPLVENRDR
ncbi:hypothetical protein EV1_022459 [Malus domestica]